MKTLTQEKPKKLENNTDQISHALKQESENKTKKLKRFIPLLFDLALTEASCWKYLKKDM